jgi:hypothetical protein
MLLLLAVPGIAVIAHAWIQTPFRRWSWLISEFGDGTLDRAVWSLPAFAAWCHAREAPAKHVFSTDGIASLC